MSFKLRKILGHSYVYSIACIRADNTFVHYIHVTAVLYSIQVNTVTILSVQWGGGSLRLQTLCTATNVRMYQFCTTPKYIFIIVHLPIV